MSVLLFSATAPGAPVPLEASALAARLRANGIVTLGVPAVAHIPDADFAKLCRRLFWSDLQAVVVVLPRRPRNLELLAERIKHIRFLFPAHIKVWLSGVGALPAEVDGLASCEQVTFDRLEAGLRALHGQLEGARLSPDSRLPLVVWPKNHERTKAAELMLQASPCSGRCGECLRFVACDWGRVPSWETFREADRQAFARELTDAVVQHKVRAFYLRDFGLDASLEKVQWLQGVMAALPEKVVFVADLQLDHWVRQPNTLELLCQAGLVGVNLDIGSLHSASRRSRGGIPLDAKQTLAAFRQMATPALLVHGLFKAGLPGDTPERLLEDVKWLLSAEGRALIDSFDFAVQDVSPDSILGRSGGYRFQGNGSWSTPELTRSQAEALVLRIEGLCDRLNFMHARWPTADAFLQAVTLGMGYPTARDFLRSAWGCSETHKTKTEDVLVRLEAIVSTTFSDQLMLGPVLG